MSTRKRRYKTIRAHDSAIVALRFDAQDRLLSAGKSGKLKQWSLRRRRVLTTFGAGNNGLASMDVSPDGSRLITADRNGFVTIWRNPSS